MSEHVAPMYSAREREAGSPLWWLLLITGTLWILFAIVVFRFDYHTVTAVAILMGTVCIAAAALEGIVAFASHGWGRAGHIALAILFTVVGIVCYVHPGNSFKALAGVFSFYLLFRGIYELVTAFLVRDVLDLWWIGLISGSVQIVLAFWAAGDFGRKTVLLVVWVGASALVQGITQIVLAFQLRPRKA